MNENIESIENEKIVFESVYSDYSKEGSNSGKNTLENLIKIQQQSNATKQQTNQTNKKESE